MQDPALILVVDDTPANLEVISEALTDAGYEVAIATDGDRALKQIQYSLPDLILLDVMMPGIDGFETCKRLKVNPQTCDIPVIFMTAFSDPENKVKGLNSGAVDYITKPFQEAEILARIKLHLQLRFLTKNLEEKVLARTAELSQALESLRESHVQLVQKEKMSALGQLVAGVAHEINNPVGFISGNLDYVEEYVKDLLFLIEIYEQNYPNPVGAIQDAIASIELDYLRDDFPKLISSMKEGVDRIRNISTSLRTFSRGDCDRPTPFNIHEGIDSTLMILKHRLKENEKRPAILVEKDYGQLPPIECFPGQINQVFMNLLANAIDALEESNQGRSFEEVKTNPNRIIIRTEQLSDSKQVLVRIKDNGIGMSDRVLEKVFDHLFTTKPVGQGTGLGLSIAHQIVVEKHGGTLDANSTLTKGSEFVVAIPIEQSGDAIALDGHSDRAYSQTGV
ncbi:hybrid sensor histidine kinase/response regulator [Argonema antarcticum]|uniref:hybrid sensor histidine kinase/response regulator n=1 Tax=Argonema antarcticum TaxID=2942763 RepID=UPI0020118F85|nr:response regulator [Argonema antarcticum]MCL1470212.1 hybrid sensor histidine kinase/response regulator [Argonema antarcticum A004/B2]